jgi:diguanylate cyclase (GGDEF)-like protein
VPAASDAVRYLQRRFGLDLWLMTHVAMDAQTVLASAGPWASTAPPGAVLPWSASFCRRMAAGQGPSVAPDVRAVPAYARVAHGPLADVRAYLGVPIVDADSHLIGTLCAVSGTRQATDLADALEPTRLIGRMLSTVLAGEALARSRSEEAAAAYALAARDRLTGLRNRLGWESALADEHARCQRYGGAASVLVVDLDDLKGTNDSAGHAAGDDLLVGCAALLADSSRPADVVARLGGDEFAVLAVQCDAVCVRALQARLRVRLRTAGISASVGSATRRAGEELADTWQRADAAMYRAKRRRKHLSRTSGTAT